MNCTFRLVIVVLAAVAMAGCAMRSSKPQTLAAPPAEISLAQFAGTSLSGAANTSLDAAAVKDAWTVSARVIAVEQLPKDARFVPIGPQARLVIGDAATTLFSPSSRLVFSTRVSPLEKDAKLERTLGPAEHWKQVKELDGGVAAGSTISFEVAPQIDLKGGGAIASRKVSIAVTRVAGQDGYDLTVAGGNLLKPDESSLSEKVIVERKLTEDADRIALAIPMQFQNSRATGVVVDLSTHQNADAKTIAQMRKQIDASASVVTAQAKKTAASPTDAAINTSLDALASGSVSRGTLIYLADQTGATLTQNVLLVADDKAMQLVVAEIRGRLPNLKSRDAATVGWMLDRSTIKAVASIKQEDSPTTLPPILGALGAYAGDVGRQLDLLSSLAEQSAGSRDLQAHITAEQLIALEDNAPGARVRAYDWLSARNLAPPGYDPLATPRERRAAVDKFAEATTRPTTPVSRK